MSERTEALRGKVLETLQVSARALKPKELARLLRLPTHEYSAFRRLLEGMEKRGVIRRVKGHRFVTASGSDQVTGTLSLIRKGDAFLRRDGGGDDIFIPGGRLSTAMDGDRVVAVIDRRPKGRSAEGRVVDVLERARETVVGTFHRMKRLSYVIPLGEKLEREILIPSPDRSDAIDGDVVVVRIRSFGDARSRPTGAT